VHILREFAPNQDYLAADAWLLQHAGRNARIASAETGLIGWQLRDDYIIDTIGLTTPKNAVYVEHREPGRWLAEDNPDFVFVHDQAWFFERIVLTNPEYVPLPETFGKVRLYKRKGE
jgi:hypothetical protein